MKKYSARYFNNRNDMINFYLKKNMIGCELGVFQGKFSNNILLTDPSKLYLVDTFNGVHTSGDENGNNMTTVNLSEYKFILKEKYKNDERVEIVQNFSQNFLMSLEDNYLDFCYIDADHSYEAVFSDLGLSLLKVKNGGFIMGHDYTPRFLGVIKAVDEFCEKNNLNVESFSECGCPSFCIVVKK